MRNAKEEYEYLLKRLDEEDVVEQEITFPQVFSALALDGVIIHQVTGLNFSFSRDINKLYRHELMR